MTVNTLAPDVDLPTHADATLVEAALLLLDAVVECATGDNELL